MNTSRNLRKSTNPKNFSWYNTKSWSPFYSRRRTITLDRNEWNTNPVTHSTNDLCILTIFNQCDFKISLTLLMFGQATWPSSSSACYHSFPRNGSDRTQESFHEPLSFPLSNASISELWLRCWTNPTNFLQIFQMIPLSCLHQWPKMTTRQTKSSSTRCVTVITFSMQNGI